MPILFECSIGKKTYIKKQTGASMIEALIAIPLMVVACMLTLQMMLLYRAKVSLNYATQEAARIGSTSNGRLYPRFVPSLGDMVFLGGSVGTRLASQGFQTLKDGVKPSGSELESGSSGSTSNAAQPPGMPTNLTQNGKNFFMNLGKGMLKYGDSSVLQGFIAGMVPFYTTGNEFTDIVKGQLTAYGDAMMNSCILYHNPTQSAFLDFAFMELEGPDKLIFQIPNDFMRYRIPGELDISGKGIGYYKKNGAYLTNEIAGLNQGISAMSIQDATILSIEIKYSAEMKVPLAREIIIGIAKIYNSMYSNETALGKKFTESAFSHGRWPMSAFATYRMRSPVHWDIFYPLGTAMNSSPAIYEISVTRGIKDLWNTVFDSIPEDNNGVKQWDPAKPQIGFCPGLALEGLGINNGPVIPTDHWVGVDYDKALKK